MEIVQVRTKHRVGDYGGYYNYEFAIVKRKGRSTVFDFQPLKNVERDIRFEYEVKPSEYKTILEE